MSNEDVRRWERHSETVFAGLPYFLLLLSAVLSTVRQERLGGEHLLGTLGLVAAAACWILCSYTLPNRGRRSREYGKVGTALYCAGLLAFAVPLLLRDEVFVLFAATVFLQALVLLPTGWAFGCVAATSFVVNTVPDGFPQGPVAFCRWAVVIAFQTLVIGWINLLTSRLDLQHRQRKETVAELQAALAENAGLHARLIAQAREAGVRDERQRLAGEIHDTLAQGLAAIIRQLEAAEDAVDDADRGRRHLATARDLARSNLTDARRSVRAMRPGQLESASLHDAMGTMVEQWRREAGLSAGFETTGTAAAMHPELEAALYRVAQEALTNIHKHAMASRVAVTLSYMDDVVVLDVCDDGVGFDPADVGTVTDTFDGHGFGLVGMRSRLRRVAGTLEIESVPGEGTAISAGVPFTPLGAGE